MKRRGKRLAIILVMGTLLGLVSGCGSNSSQNETQRRADRIGIMVNGELKAIRKSGDLFERRQR